MSQPAILGPASVIALGNVVSRLLGLVRETVMAALFGATGLVSAYRVAANVPTMLHDLLVGGIVTSALVPVFSDYAERDQAELWRVASLVISLSTVVLAAFVILGELVAPWLAWLLAGGFPAPLLAETIFLMRIGVPALLFLSLSSIISGLLYGLRRFAFPAFTAAIFNAAVVLVAFLGAERWGIRSMALGLLAGAILQVALQIPGLRPMRFTPKLDLRHEGLSRILHLSLPIFGGLLISQLAIGIDRNLASRTGEQSIAWMQYATTLIQFPLGMVSAAVSLSILPTLSRYTLAYARGGLATEEDRLAAFRATLGKGLRLVLLLIIPATAGLFLLSEPIVRVVFQRGDFMPFDTLQTTRALRVYLVGLAFAAVDQPLIFAFYARQDTLTPAIVGVLGVCIYLAVALPLLRPFGMIGLVLANSIQWVGHALTMLWLARARFDALGGQGLLATTGQALLAALLMAVPVMGVRHLVETMSGTAGLPSGLLTVIASAGLGGLVYAGALVALGVEEGRSASQWLRAHLTPS